MKSNLSSRLQKVFYNGSRYNLSHLVYGIPQGSCLGPSAVKNAGITMCTVNSTVYYAETTCHE